MKIAEVIKFEGDNSTFIWKHPSEDFNTNTQLIVHESQEAILFLNGEALDLFGPGRHSLATQNIPFLTKAVSGFMGGENPFHCEVYFINKTVQMAIKWGTEQRIRFIEPTMGIPMELGACGEMNLAVCDSRKLLVKLVGTMRGIAWDEKGMGFTKSIQNCFRPLIASSVKVALPNVIKNENIDVFELEMNLDKLSEGLRKSIVGGFEEYGLTIPQLYVTNVVYPENDQNIKQMRELRSIGLKAKVIQAEAFIKSTQAEADAGVVAAARKVELERQLTQTEVAKRAAERELIAAQTEADSARIKGYADIELDKAGGLAQADVIRAQGLAQADAMRAQGYTQKDVLQADVQKAYAEGIGNMTINGGSAGGGVAGEMLGLGVGIATAGAVAPHIGEMLKGFNPGATVIENAAPTAQKCAKCGADLPENAKFCLECGEKVAPAIPDNMIVCPECGSTVQKGKFCPECGHKFITACPKCGTTLTAGAKFCPECGEKL